MHSTLLSKKDNLKMQATKPEQTILFLEEPSRQEEEKVSEFLLCVMKTGSGYLGPFLFYTHDKILHQ